MSEELLLRWCQGFDDSCVGFIDQDVLCHKSGRALKFWQKDGSFHVYSPKSRNVAHIAVHCNNKVFAVAESTVINPKVFVVEYPSFKDISQMEGASSLDINAIAFSSSSVLCIASGVPDYELSLWNFKIGCKLTTTSILDIDPISLSFNPANWKQICITESCNIHVWTVERCNDLYHMQKEFIKMPPRDSTVNWIEYFGNDGSRLPTRNSTRMSRTTIDLPQATLAGVASQHLQEFEAFFGATNLTNAVSHVWTLLGNLYVGGDNGQLVRVCLNTERKEIRLLLNPLMTEPSFDRKITTLSENVELDLQNYSSLNQVSFSSMTSMVLGKSGIYVAGEDGKVRLIRFDADAHVSSVEDVFTTTSAIKHLCFNLAYTELAVVNSGGELSLVEVLSEKKESRTLFDINVGNFVGVALLPIGNDIVASVRENGQVQLWELDSGQIVSNFSLDTRCSSMAASPLVNLLLVGTENGRVLIIDCTKVYSLRIVSQTRLHQSAVKHICCDSEGEIYVTASDDGYCFVASIKPSLQFQCIGFTSVPDDVQDLSIAHDLDTRKIYVALVSSVNSLTQANKKLTYFELSHDLLANPSQHFKSRRCDFNDESIRKMDLNFSQPTFGCALQIHNGAASVFAISQTSRCLQRISIPDEPPKKLGSKASYLMPEREFLTVELDDPCAKLLLSPDGALLSIFGADSFVRVVHIKNITHPLIIRAHDTNTGGVKNALFTLDSTSILTIGRDESLQCFKLKLSTSTLNVARDYKNTVVSENLARAHNEMTILANSQTISLLDENMPEDKDKDHAEQRDLTQDSIQQTPTPTLSRNLTWLQAQEAIALYEDDQHYSEAKKELRRQLRDMKRQINELVDKNKDLPDLERLESHEFELDLDVQQTIQAETQIEVNKVREEIEFQNLVKQFTREVIKKECWDEMKTKGRSIQAFNQNLEVTNYALRELTAEEIATLEVVVQRRRMELRDLKERREYAEDKTGITLEDHEDMEDEKGKENSTLAGSAGSALGGGSDLFYNQFNLVTREQKNNQIILLQDAIQRMKENFNKDFQEVYIKKTQEIGKIKEKNVRIRKILSDLNLDPSDVKDVVLSSSEHPEDLLIVEDDEVTVEKFLTPEQRKKLEEERQLEAERRRREEADNWRERGLDDMMGGLLEVKKEDELKKDVPKPNFMNTKSEVEWNEEEKKLALEYEQKVKELNEERDKYKKFLESELKKLMSFIEEGRSAFDETLDVLFNKKIATQMAIYQEELKIWRLKYALLVEEELTTRQRELKASIELRNSEKENAHAEAKRARKVVEVHRERYDILSAEDKVQEKNFKKDFNDQPTYIVEQLTKLYRRRPRKNIKAAEPSLMLTATHQHQNLSSHNPYAERPTSAQHRDEQRTALDQALSELDNERNMPEGIDSHVWERLCASRRSKIMNENELRLRALELSEMQAYQSSREAEVERLRTEIEDLDAATEQLHVDKRRYITNLEVQLLLKQGQVEVDPTNGFIHDYTDSLLIHRGVVEELNSKIRSLGEGKVQHMIEGKDFKKKFIQLEWELKKMRMEVADLRNKMKDIQSFKINREIQRYLNTENYDGLIAMEINKMEQAMTLMAKHHEEMIDNQKKRLKELQQVKSKRLENKNEIVGQEVSEMNVSVNERMHIENVNAEKRDEASGVEKRYKQILQRQKLVDLAKAQAKEVAVLRAEVERLRMRTFPALIQNK